VITGPNPFVQRTRESRHSFQFGRQRSLAADKRPSAESVRRGFAEFVAVRCSGDLPFSIRRRREVSSGVRLAPDRMRPERAAAWGGLGAVDCWSVEFAIWMSFGRTRRWSEPVPALRFGS